jgi:hypothetical protein
LVLLIRLKAEHSARNKAKADALASRYSWAGKVINHYARSELTERVLHAAFTKDAQAAEATGQSVDGALLAQLRKDERTASRNVDCLQKRLVFRRR